MNTMNFSQTPSSAPASATGGTYSNIEQASALFGLHPRYVMLLNTLLASHMDRQREAEQIMTQINQTRQYLSTLQANYAAILQDDLTIRNSVQTLLTQAPENTIPPAAAASAAPTTTTTAPSNVYSYTFPLNPNVPNVYTSNLVNIPMHEVSNMTVQNLLESVLPSLSMNRESQGGAHARAQYMSNIDINSAVRSLFQDTTTTTVPTMEQISRATRIVKYSDIIRPTNTQCSISHENFEDDDRVTILLGCKHLFRPDCIQEWFRNHATCPVCRHDIRTYEPSSSSSASVSAAYVANNAMDIDD